MSATITDGSTNATFDGQNSLTFQTGTTAGTLTFTLSFADGDSYKVRRHSPVNDSLASAGATRQAPNLVVDVTAFDNTYSASKLLFNFYDTNGNAMAPAALRLERVPGFPPIFLRRQRGRGAVALQAKLPVTGDLTTVGSVDVTIQNSQGQSKTQRLAFQ